jgi:hypothetical protein
MTLYAYIAVHRIFDVTEEIAKNGDHISTHGQKHRLHPATSDLK